MKDFVENEISKRMSVYTRIMTDIKKIPLENVTQRNFRMAGVVTDLFKTAGAPAPIVVGGLSVNLYTEGEYATQDIDMMGIVNDAIVKALSDLGFIKEGRCFSNEALQIFIEFPSYPFSGDESLTSERTTDDALPVRVIGIEDILVDRIRARINWNEAYQTKWIREMWLRHQNEVNADYVRAQLVEQELAFFDSLLKAYSNNDHTGKKLAKKFELELEIVYHDQIKDRVFYSVSEDEETVMLFPGPSSFTDEELFGEYFGISFYPVLNLFLKHLDTGKFHPYVENYQAGMTINEVTEAINLIAKRDEEIGKRTNNYSSLINILNRMT